MTKQVERENAAEEVNVMPDVTVGGIVYRYDDSLLSTECGELHTEAVQGLLEATLKSPEEQKGEVSRPCRCLIGNHWAVVRFENGAISSVRVEQKSW